VCVCVFAQTLYKTQVRELKEECEDRNKFSKDTQQSLQDLQEERWVARPNLNPEIP